MEPSKDRGCRRNAFPIRVALALALLILATAPALLAQSDWIGPEALAQMKAIADDKRARTPAQKKIDSNLIYASRQTRGQPAATGVPMLQTFIDVGPAGDTVVDITGVVTPSLIARLQELGGSVVDSQPSYRSLRAIVPLASLEPLAEHPGVIFIQPKQEAMLMGAPVPTRAAGAAAPFNRVSRLSVKSIRPDFSVRAENVRRQLGAALKTLGAKSGGASPSVPAKTNTSEGRVTHRADLAASTFGATGAGIKVGVLSDGVNSLASLQASGDLPAVTVLAGQAGSGDEGSAMLEIVFDMAPSAQLFFATANTSITSFAQNIRDLRTAGCDVIIDDVGYFVESPFQKGQAGSVVSTSNGGVVTQAVVDVAAGGALYFSSSANSGSKDKGTSGTWEGDFVDGGLAGGILAGAGHLHDFDPGAGTTTFDTITAAGGFTFLFWSDPLGGSSNDYDLYILNSAGTKVLGASTNTQNGTQDPIEGLTGSPLNDRVVIALFSGSARFLHLDTNRGKLTFNTAGNSHGHNAPPGPGAFGVAATPAAAACCGGGANPVGPFPNPFNSANTVELFSSDGLRQYFFNADSSAITPGNFLAGGGEVVQQPLVSAADGVSCAAPGFNPFFGTSAAAPHAGAIAALVKSVNPSLTAAQIKTILTSTAIDIEAAGTDRDSGFGILDAFSAVQAGVPGGTPTPTRTSTPTNTPSNTPTKTNTPTNTPTSTKTPTNTPTNAFTFTNTPTKTVTTSPTFTPTNTPTSTKTPTNTPTNTAVVSTNTPTVTPTPTNSTPTASKTPTPTNTPTSTPTNTPTRTPTNTPTLTVTPTPQVLPAALAVDSAANGGFSDGNAIFEPGERVVVKPSWKNNGAPINLTGALSNFTGPAGPTYTINDASGGYGTIGTGATAVCADCYEISVSSVSETEAPAVARPVTHWDSTVTESLSGSQGSKVWTIHIGESFTDVPKSHVFYQFVEKLLHFGVTSGCSLTTYCPDDNVFRLQMAVFISRAQAGGDANIPVSGSAQGNPYNCVLGGTSQFLDIAPDNPFCRHVHYIFGTGVTTGCVTTPPRQYCPGDNVTRGQMSIFIARAVAGSDAAVPVTYGPDPVTGRSYSCNPATPNLFFTDITTSDLFCRHTHFLWAKNVISGFPDGTFGPGLFVTRGAMSKFISNGFGFTLYRP